jgi:hypothetical protein
MELHLHFHILVCLNCIVFNELSTPTNLPSLAFAISVVWYILLFKYYSQQDYYGLVRDVMHIGPKMLTFQSNLIPLVSLFYPEDLGSLFLRNFGTCVKRHGVISQKIVIMISHSETKVEIYSKLVHSFSDASFPNFLSTSCSSSYPHLFFFFHLHFVVKFCGRYEC